MRDGDKFSERLAELMLYADNITTDKLGEKTGFGGSTIRLWKTGKRLPSLSNAIKLATYFNCSLDFLFARTDGERKYTQKPLPQFHAHFLLFLEKNGISWYKVVKDTKISKSNIQDWRDGREPLIPTLIELADYFKCSLDELVGLE